MFATTYACNRAITPSSDLPTVQKLPHLYDLYGVVVHHGGSSNSGHYFSFVKAPNGAWHCMNDESVSTVGWNLVKQQQAYMLFYAQKPGPRPAPVALIAPVSIPRAIGTKPDAVAPAASDKPKPAVATTAGVGISVASTSEPTLETLASARWNPPRKDMFAVKFEPSHQLLAPPDALFGAAAVVAVASYPSSPAATTTTLSGRAILKGSIPAISTGTGEEEEEEGGFNPSEVLKWRAARHQLRQWRLLSASSILGVDTGVRAERWDMDTVQREHAAFLGKPAPTPVSMEDLLAFAKTGAGMAAKPSSTAASAHPSVNGKPHAAAATATASSRVRSGGDEESSSVSTPEALPLPRATKIAAAATPAATTTLPASNSFISGSKLLRATMASAARPAAPVDNEESDASEDAVKVSTAVSVSVAPSADSRHHQVAGSLHDSKRGGARRTQLERVEVAVSRATKTFNPAVMTALPSLVHSGVAEDSTTTSGSGLGVDAWGDVGDWDLAAAAASSGSAPKAAVSGVKRVRPPPPAPLPRHDSSVRMFDEEYAHGLSKDEWNAHLDQGKLKKVKIAAEVEEGAPLSATFQSVHEAKVKEQSVMADGRGYTKGHYTPSYYPSAKF